jgi:hypothetical protein
VLAGGHLLGESQVQDPVLSACVGVFEHQDVVARCADAVPTHRGTDPAAYARAVEQVGVGVVHQVVERAELVDVELAGDPVAVAAPA